MNPTNYDHLRSQHLRIYKCRDRAKGANSRFEKGIITADDVLNAIRRFDYKCAYCAKKITPKYWQLDHFYSKHGGGTNTPENLVPTCRWCNQMKHALDGFAFINKCREVLENNLIIPMVGMPEFFENNLKTKI